MDDLLQYLEEHVDPTIKDFENYSLSVRHAFLACVVTFHMIDYLAHPRRAASLRQEFLKKSKAFETVDHVAHAFKHVRTGPRDRPFKSNEVISRPPGIWGVMEWDLSRWDDPVGGVTLDSDRHVDLLDVVREARDFIIDEGRKLPRKAKAKHNEPSPPQSGPR